MIHAFAWTRRARRCAGALLLVSWHASFPLPQQDTDSVQALLAMVQALNAPGNGRRAARACRAIRISSRSGCVADAWPYAALRRRSPSTAARSSRSPRRSHGATAPRPLPKAAGTAAAMRVRPLPCR
eukprot:5256247-Prymnesium_polylepis.1